MDIKTIILKGKRWIWIPVVLAIIGGVAGFYNANRIVPTPFATVTLITLDTDRAIIFGMEMTLDEVLVSRRVATELLGIINSTRVTRLASLYLSELGHDIHYRSLGGMTSIAPIELGSPILRLRVSAGNPDIVVDVANAMAIAFVDTLYEFTGTVYITVLDYAERVSYTSGGNRRMYTAAGMVGGAAVGMVILYMLILADNRIKTIDDVKRITGGLKVTIIPLHHIK
jgi:capsular polysaccharide biosynthesis protein